jgi:hypothetical protein
VNTPAELHSRPIAQRIIGRRMAAKNSRGSKLCFELKRLQALPVQIRADQDGDEIAAVSFAADDADRLAGTRPRISSLKARRISPIDLADAGAPPG